MLYPRFVILALSAVSFAACTVVTDPLAPEAVACLDETDFRQNVEPILIRDCSYMACHGLPNSPLRLYSIGKLRRGDNSTLEARTLPLSEEEHHLNFLSAQAFSFGGVAPADSLLVRKPMPAASGGYEHKGGAMWTGTSDPDVMAIRDWLGRRGTCAP